MAKAFAAFRLAAILDGVYKRGEQGNARCVCCLAFAVR
jgi:hypothetical protein